MQNPPQTPPPKNPSSNPNPLRQTISTTKSEKSFKQQIRKRYEVQVNQIQLKRQMEGAQQGGKRYQPSVRSYNQMNQNLQDMKILQKFNRKFGKSNTEFIREVENFSEKSNNKYFSSKTEQSQNLYQLGQLPLDSKLVYKEQKETPNLNLGSRKKKHLKIEQRIQQQRKSLSSRRPQQSYKQLVSPIRFQRKNHKLKQAQNHKNTGKVENQIINEMPFARTTKWQLKNQSVNRPREKLTASKMVQQKKNYVRYMPNRVFKEDYMYK